MNRVIYRKFRALTVDGKLEQLMDRPVGKPRTCLESEWMAIEKLPNEPELMLVKLAVVEDRKVESEINKMLNQGGAQPKAATKPDQK